MPALLGFLGVPTGDAASAGLLLGGHGQQCKVRARAAVQGQGKGSGARSGDGQRCKVMARPSIQTGYTTSGKGHAQKGGMNSPGQERCAAIGVQIVVLVGWLKRGGILRASGV